MATLVGSPPNTQMAGALSASYDIQISFADWMKIGGPVSLIIFVLLSLIFQIILGEERNTKIKNDMLKSNWTKPQKRVMTLLFL